MPGQPDSFLAGLLGVTTPEGAPEVARRVPSEQMVRDALEEDSRVDAYVVIVRVEDRDRLPDGPPGPARNPRLEVELRRNAESDPAVCW